MSYRCQTDSENKMDVGEDSDCDSDSRLPTLNKYYTPHVQGQRFDSGQRHLILNVYSRLRQSNFGNVGECSEEAARLTGSSKKLIGRLKREWSAAEDAQCTNKPRLTTPGKKRARRPARLQYVDHFDRDAIRKILHRQFIRSNEVPSVIKTKINMMMTTMPDVGGSVDDNIEDEGDGAESDTPPDTYFTANGNRRTFTSGQRHLILNVYSRLRKADFGNVTECIAETTRLTGASKATVSKLKRQFNAAEDAQCTSKPRLTTPGRKRVNRLPPHANLDHFDRAAIRKLIHTQFIRCNQVPAVWKVKAFIDADPNLPNMGKTSLHRLLKDMGIQFKKRRRNAAVIEDDDVRLWRQNYLRQVKAHREAGRKLYWLDETWLSGQSGVISTADQSSAAKPNMNNNNNNINNQEHVDQTTMMTSTDDQLQGATATTPSRKVLPIGVGKCDRLIVAHAGSDTGFVDGALFVFENRKVGDSQTEMSADVFEEWFAKTLLPRIEPNSVIVLSNAPYHSVKMEKIPEKGCNKAEIQAWLSSKGIAYTDDMIVLELLELVNQVKDRYDVYRVDVAARLAGHTVLRLPPHHTFLNPIDMVFDQIKQYVCRESSKVSTLAEVRRLLHEGVARVTAYNWSCCVQYVRKEEEIMRNAPDDGSDSDASGGDMDEGHDDGAAVWSDDSE